MSKTISTIPSADRFQGTTYIRQAQLIQAVLPFSAATLWRKVKNGSFPKPVKLSDRITAWRMDEIQSWLESCHAK